MGTISFSGFQDTGLHSTWQTSYITTERSFGYTRKTGSRSDHRLLLKVTLTAGSNESIDSFSLTLRIVPSHGTQNPNPYKNFGVEGYLYENESVLRTNLLNPPGGYISHAAESSAVATRVYPERTFTITFSGVHCTSNSSKDYYIWVGGISASDAWLMEFWGGSSCSVTITGTSTLAGAWRKPISLEWSPTKSSNGYYSGLRVTDQNFTISVPSGYYAYGSQNNSIYYRKNNLRYDAQTSMTDNSVIRYASCNSVSTDSITASLSSTYYSTIYLPRLCFSGFFDKEYCINTRQYSGSNSKITAPSISSLSGWVFLGYRTSTSAPTSDSVNYTTWATSSPNNIALYGLLKKTLTFNPNGGSSNGSTSSKTYTEYKYGTSSGLSTTGNYSYTASRTGYAFSCWMDSDGDEYSSMADAFKRADSGSTLTAVWSEYKITVKYKANGGTLTPNTTNTTRYRVYNDIVQKSTDSGSTWNDLSASYGISSTYPDLHNVTNPDWYNGGVQKTGYYITGTEAFYLDGNPSLKVNQDYTEDSPTNPSTAYRLNGNANLTTNKTIYLVINWKPNPYTLTANANGGTISARSSDWSVSNNRESATKTVNYASTYGSLPTPIRTGYDFNNWYTATTGGNEVTSSTTMGAADATIYAHWIAKQFNITFDQQNGSGGTTTITATYDSPLPAIITPKREGYQFLGYYLPDTIWSSDSSMETSVTNYGGMGEAEYTFSYNNVILDIDHEQITIYNNDANNEVVEQGTPTYNISDDRKSIDFYYDFSTAGYPENNSFSFEITFEYQTYYISPGTIQYYNNAGNPTITSWDKDHDVTLYAKWEFRGMYYYKSSGERWVRVIPFIYTNDGWKETQPFVYTSNGWKSLVN